MANLTRFTPLDELFNEVTRGFFVKPLSFPADSELRMKLEVKDEDKWYLIRAEVPGVKKDDIKVDVNGDLVTIRAEVKKEKEEKEGDKVIHSEREYGILTRSFSLPNAVDPQGAKAEYKDGILALTLPKKAGEQMKRISIQ